MSESKSSKSTALSLEEVLLVNNDNNEHQNYEAVEDNTNERDSLGDDSGLLIIDDSFRGLSKEYRMALGMLYRSREQGYIEGTSPVLSETDMLKKEQEDIIKRYTSMKRYHNDVNIHDDDDDNDDIICQREISEETTASTRTWIDENCIGLAFSGGGIRAAEFDCGVLWKMSELGLLKNVHHLSSVSGGSYCSAAFITHILDTPPPLIPSSGKSQKSSMKEDVNNNNNNNNDKINGDTFGVVDDWYRHVVANLIDRMQRNAGFIMSFEKSTLFETPKDGSSKFPHIFDGIQFVLVVLGMFCVSPIIFTIFFAFPIAHFQEAMFGATLRDNFCFSAMKGELDLADVLQTFSNVQLFSQIYIILFVSFLLVAVVQIFNLMPKKKPYTSWLCLNAFKDLAFFGVLFLTMQGVIAGCMYGLQSFEYGSSTDILELCGKYITANKNTTDPTNFICSDALTNGVLWYDQKRYENLTQNYNGFSINGKSNVNFDQNNDYYKKERSNYPWTTLTGKEPNDENNLNNTINGEVYDESSEEAKSFATVIFTILGTLIPIGLMGLAIGIKLILYVAALIGPLCFLYAVTCICQWKVFGPVTEQSLLSFTSFIFNPDVFKYTANNWNSILSIFVSFSIILLILPIYGKLHTFVHYWFRNALQKAFFSKGQDHSIRNCANIYSPNLILGCTVNNYMRPNDESPYSSFSITQNYMGGERVGYLETSERLMLSKAMALSGAAVDGLILTTTKFTLRFWLFFLNLFLGDFQSFYHDRKRKIKQTNHSIQVMIDNTPVTCLLVLVYIFLLVSSRTNNQSRVYDAPHKEFKSDCRAYYTTLWFAADIVLIIVIGTLFSFMPHIRFFRYSAFTRQIETLCLHKHVNNTAPEYIYLSDGGLTEDLGIVELLRRNVKIMICIDAGDDPKLEMTDLRNAIKVATKQRLCSFYDKEDPRRDLDIMFDQYREGNIPYIHLGVLYGWDDNDNNEGEGEEKSAEADKKQKTGEIYHIRMKIPKNDQKVIQPSVKRSEIINTDENNEKEFGCRHHDNHDDNDKHYCNCYDEEIGDKTTTTKYFDYKNILRRNLGGMCCLSCHKLLPSNDGFPNVDTSNQFFTKIMAANFIRLGYELSEEALIDIKKNHFTKKDVNNII